MKLGTAGVTGVQPLPLHVPSTRSKKSDVVRRVALTEPADASVIVVAEML